MMHLARRVLIALLLLGVYTPLPLLGQTKKGSTKGKSNPKVTPATPGSANGIKEYSSENFLLHTDLTADAAIDLLERLEKMIALVGKYYGRPNSQTIEMYVVDNRNHWPAGSIPAAAESSILADAGITLSLTQAVTNGLGEKQILTARSVVWAVASRGIPQHEAVHAYCHQTFGSTGPTWYSEGMAELGSHWRENDVSIQISDEILRYLKNSPPKELAEITATGQKTGDSWQNYAWRWALCHLLSTNSNYAPRFKPLGMALLNQRPTSFNDVYGTMSREIEFEYRLFLNDFGQGYRSDLCNWDWKTKFQRLRGTSTVQARVAANRGWQATRVQVKAGDQISYTATGEWELDKLGSKFGPDGDSAGRGRLVTAIFADYQLSDPIELGSEGSFVAEQDGNLFVRCRDDWCEIADNSGVVTVKFKSVP